MVIFSQIQEPVLPRVIAPTLFICAHCIGLFSMQSCSTYRTRAIISRGLYIFYPIFEDHFFVFREVFSENSVFMYG